MKKLTYVLLVLITLLFPIPLKAQVANFKIPILIYHRVQNCTAPTCVSEANFAEQMQWLKDNGYKTIDLDTVMYHKRNSIPFPEKSIVITMDDGYSTQYTKAYPEFKKHGFKAVIYVVTGLVGTQYFLSWPQLKEMQRTGHIQVGSHTLNHLDLKNLSNTDMQAVINEVAQSKILLENEMLVPVKHFAFPYGQFNQAVISELVNAGYETATTTQSVICDMNTVDLYKMPRVFVGPTTTIEQFEQSITII